MAENLPPPAKSSWAPPQRSSRVTPVLAGIGVLALIAATTVVLHRVGAIEFDLLRFFADSDEAPIRVRNGSLDIFVLSPSQKWESDNAEWKIKDASRFKDEFEVTVAARSGAECSPSHVASGAAVVVTYSDGAKITFHSAGRRTRIRTDRGTINRVADDWLRYGAQGSGHITQVAVGSVGSPNPLCTFTQANQLDHLVILNVPQTH